MREPSSYRKPFAYMLKGMLGLGSFQRGSHPELGNRAHISNMAAQLVVGVKMNIGKKG